MKNLFKTLMTLVVFTIMCASLESCHHDHDELDPWIGAWQGGDGEDEVYIVLGSNQKYSDCYIIDGKKDEMGTATYSVMGNTLIIAGYCALYQSWGSEYTISFNGDYTIMYLSNDLLERYGQMIVLFRVR